MLDEYKKLYEEVAAAGLPEWKSINKNELIKTASYLENGYLKDSYVAAIMLNYWNKIGKFYSKCKLVTSPEDIHTWLTISVLYALDRRPWESENSSIYNDPNGPDKVINRCMECRRITFYQQLNRYNRKINSAILSLDSLIEDYKDLVLPSNIDSALYDIYDIINEKFNKKEYVAALILDAILYEDFTDIENNYKRLCNYIRRLNNNDIVNISERYNISEEVVQKAIKYCNDLTIDHLRRQVQYSIIKLKDINKDL